jgi:3-oxoacyl-[acyl-carrier-protein] synthase-3
MKTVRVSSIGVGLPEKKLTNADLSSMVDTTDEWIVQRTGIKERRIVDKGVHASDLAVLAAKDCLSKTDRVPELLISSCGSPERIYPYQASFVANQLGLENLAAFDMCAACSGLVYSIGIAWSMMETIGYKNALLTASENMTMFTDYKDRKNCVLFGDGASALLLSTEAEGHELLAIELGIDAKGADLVTMGARDGNPLFWQNGKRVYLFAVAKIIELIEILKKKAELGTHDPFFVVPHQANQRMFEAVSDRSGLPIDHIISNIERYGNTSSASVGIALEEASRENKFSKGDVIFLIGFGAGLSWGGAAMRW